jgi:Domain of unknown function (DUF6766)
MGRLFRDNGLSLVVLGIFLALWGGQAVVGWQAYNQDEAEHGRPAIRLTDYLISGNFWEATGENWESEFLQMGAFVVLTAYLYQKGSAESREPGERMPQDEDPELHRDDSRAPWPVRRGGWVLWLYARSLSITLLLLFAASFLIHLFGGAAAHCQEQTEHGQPPTGVLEFLVSWQFWFQSLQNWQSEFLAIGAMVILSIFLRHKGSPESKPVHTPHSEGGD